MVENVSRDTRLGETVMAYVSKGMMLALEGFDHSVWGVRNSCTLLFSALMTRIFGVNRSKQDVERKNCLTVNTFFSRFPELYEFLRTRMLQLTENKCVYSFFIIALPTISNSRLANND